MTEPSFDPDFDAYKTLQVDPEADPEVIQAAFRRLAQKWHPDVASEPEAVRRMTSINRAWEVLGDPARRAAYDRARSERRSWPGSVSPSGGGAGSGASRSAPLPPRPAGGPSGSVLNFGRFNGWSLGEIARVDLEYIEWLDRTPIGRPYREEVDEILRRTGRRKSPEVQARERRGLFRRR